MMARKYAPDSGVGFPPSPWAGTSITAAVTWMNKVGTQNADCIVGQTGGRDALCPAAGASDCGGMPQTGVCWDETNQTAPNLQEHLAQAQPFHTGIGGLPILWWQVSLGVASDTPGGTVSHHRDNKVHYILTKAPQFRHRGRAQGGVPAAATAIRRP
jgi:hypothetical protein